VNRHQRMPGPELATGYLPRVLDSVVRSAFATLHQESAQKSTTLTIVIGTVVTITSNVINITITTTILNASATNNNIFTIETNTSTSVITVASAIATIDTYYSYC